MTKQEAINAKCKDCNYDNNDVGSWREQVESCKSTDCALWEYRPLTSGTIKANQEIKIQQMTPDELEKFRKKQNEARLRLGNRK
jgi:hypothetical protein